MIKITLTIFLLIKLFIGTSFAENEFKIVLKINKRVITNIDITNETKYLIALNPQISTLPEKDIIKISKQSLIKEITKEDEIKKFFEIDYNQKELLTVSNVFGRLNLKSEKEIKDYLSQNNLSLKEILRKLSIEASWNKLVFEKYKDQVNIDEEKIRDTLDNLLKDPKEQKLYLLSEILFAAENKIEFNKKFKEIIETIEEQGFKNAASIFSMADSSNFGGEIGWVKKSQLSNQVSTALTNLNKDDFSNPIKIPSGFLIIKLNDVKSEKLVIDYNEELKKIIFQEKNKQLNQFSNIYFKKVKRNSYINEE